MEYITLHANQAAYDAVKDSLPTPQVALIQDSMTVNYKPYVPTPSHDYVEIGGLKWATMNVGANSETDYGNYYQYGKGAAQYAATSGESDYSGTENPLAASADTATQEWGGDWRMPTQAELESLTANTNYTWETDFNGSGVNGGKFTDKTDNSKYIFIPTAGNYSNGRLYDVGSYGDVWSSTPNGDDRAYSLDFYDGGEGVSHYLRKNGFSVRPVLGVMDE